MTSARSATGERQTAAIAPANILRMAVPSLSGARGWNPLRARFCRGHL